MFHKKRHIIPSYRVFKELQKGRHVEGVSNIVCDEDARPTKDFLIYINELISSEYQRRQNQIIFVPLHCLERRPLKDFFKAAPVLGLTRFYKEK